MAKKHLKKFHAYYFRDIYYANTMVEGVGARTGKINGSREKKMKKRGEREKIRQKGEETPQKFPSLWVQNIFFWERGRGNNKRLQYNLKTKLAKMS